MIAQKKRGGSRGQGTLGYLVGVGVVVIASLIVVNTVITANESNSGINSKQSKLFWAAQELAIIDAAADSNGNMLLIIQNNLTDGLRIDSFTIDGTVSSTNDSNTLWRGNKKAFSLSGVSACSGASKSYKISIQFTTITNSLSKRAGPSYLVIDCSSSSLVSSPPSAAFNFSGSAVNGCLPVSNGSDVYLASGTALYGLILPLDLNKMCFNGTGCTVYVDQNGTDLIFNAP